MVTASVYSNVCTFQLRPESLTGHNVYVKLPEFTQGWGFNRNDCKIPIHTTCDRYIQQVTIFRVSLPCTPPQCDSNKAMKICVYYR